MLDGCWDIDGIFDYARQLGVKVTGALYSHGHFDHTGGHVPTEMTMAMVAAMPKLLAPKDPSASLSLSYLVMQRERWFLKTPGPMTWAST